MFFKHSRYKNQEPEVTTDARGRSLKSVPLRITPAPSGTVRHTLTEGDRLDHLSWTCYRTPHLWWHIADANPEFLSPRALMGDGPFKTVRVPIDFGSEAPRSRRSELLRSLNALAGVEEADIHEAHSPPDQRTANTLVICYNHLTLGTEELIAAITEAGWIAGTPQPVERTGKSIVLADM
ncbi:hypothetical protein [Desulfoluna spongiiphila]|uniref:LysM domain-containing protein n=1 Tax=Desulfoluna spongiiphila TaxID=419481 RepID=A0A1G5J1V3_9BACT|nr:hypothetical protein [Desulfoluna spongiiphila]SCY82335.1 hypothetical protein SAMN05216233_12421 [Desulfoluna spongiiphila]